MLHFKRTCGVVYFGNRIAGHVMVAIVYIGLASDSQLQGG